MHGASSRTARIRATCTMVVRVASLALGATCADFIVAPETPAREVRAIQLSSFKVSLDDGTSSQLVATVLDQHGTAFDQLPEGVHVQWASSATDIATVDAQGVVTAGHPGGTRVTASVSGKFGSSSVGADVAVLPVPTTIAVAGGDGQEGEVGSSLGQKARVHVSDRHGDGVPQLVVAFKVTVGDGSLDAALATTDDKGDASVQWTLGTVVGANRIEAQTVRLPGAVVAFTATAVHGAVSALVKVSGDAQTATVNTTLAAPLVARVTDRYGNAIGGVGVDWSVVSGGGSIAGTSGVTDAGGVTTAQFTLGASVGPQSARAAIGSVLSATFTATATAATPPPPAPPNAPSPATSTVTTSAASVASGSNVSLTLQAKDTAGNNLSTGGSSVVFSTSGGSSTGTISATTDHGDGTYTAIFTGVVAGSATTITAMLDGAAVSTAMPAIMVTPGPASVASSVVSVSSSSVEVGQTATLTLRAKDAAGNSEMSGGLTVVFTASAGTSAGTIGATTDHGDGSYTAPFTATTDGTPTTIGATINSDAVTSALPTLQVVPAPPPPPPPPPASKVLHWIGSNGNWSDVSHWDLGRVPTAEDTVYLDASGTYTVTVNQAVNVAKMFVGQTATGSVTLSAVAFDLTASDSIVVRAGGKLFAHAAVLTVPVLQSKGQVLVEATGGPSLVTIRGTFINDGNTAIEADPMTIEGGFENSGRFEMALGNRKFILAPQNAAQVVKSSGTFLINSGKVDLNLAAGQAFRNTGDFFVGPSAVLTVRGGEFSTHGVLAGSGTIDVSNAQDGQLSPNGVLRPGGIDPGNTGTMTIVGKYITPDDAEGSTIEIELAGTTVGDYDRLVITGSSYWIGTEVKVTLFNSFMPQNGNSFPIISYASKTSGTATTSLPPLTEGEWDVHQDNTELVLTAWVPGKAMQLSFSAQPSGVAVNTPFSVTVAGLDFKNNLSASFSGSVSVALGNNLTGATLSGTTTVTAVNGVATFSDLGIDKIGDGYTLVASSNGLASATSTAFNVGASAPPVVTFASVSAGTDHTCGLTTTGAAYCWGANWDGQLGNGTMTASNVPVAVLGGITFTSVSAGYQSSCGVATGGAAYCWGNFDTTPQPVSGNLTWATISVGNSYQCGLTTAGAAYCWGYNGYGNLGNGDNTFATQYEPTPVVGSLTFASISAQTTHTCGVTTAGEGWCWGYNGEGQLGTGSNAPTYSNAPLAVTGGFTFVTISVGSEHSCGLTNDSTILCWGRNEGGRLGDGTTTDHWSPTPIAGTSTYLSLAVGNQHTCAVASTGAAHCWGTNGFGQLGDATFIPRSTPTAVAGGLTYSRITSGSDFTCGVTTSGDIYCWGANSDGRLGNGTTNVSTSPIKVVKPGT